MPLRAALAAGAVLTVLVTGGCAAADASSDDASAAPTTSAAPVAETAAGTDEDSCAGFGDVMTIMHNVGAAVHDGRIQRGQIVVLEAMGGGFTWGAAVVRF